MAEGSFRTDSWFARLVVIAFLLSLALVIVSSWMRLSNQGLGCADWPACYGLVDTTRYIRDIDPQAADAGPTRSAALTPTKLVERTHRIVASLLQLSVLAIAVVAWRGRRQADLPVAGPLLLLGLSLFLAFLGIWYGSPLLRPPVVMANLLGGMAILGLLWWQCLSLRGESGVNGLYQLEGYRIWAITALLIVVAQTALGGWISSNFAALACMTFPGCNGINWSEMNFSGTFTVHSVLDVDASGRVVSDKSTAAGIQALHRVGALSVLLVVGLLGYKLMKLGGCLRTIALAVLIILLAQVLLGFVVTIMGSPLAVVVTHNVVAALLWLSLITLIYYLYKGTGDVPPPHSASRKG